MNIAFYAPMKPPTSPLPSGDRRMARALMAALAHAGNKVELASCFASRDGLGDGARQEKLRRVGQRLADRLIRRYRARPAGARPHLWFTYHLYYKAPDWLGPRVCDGLGIPYAVAEASHAAKRRDGPWDLGHRAAGQAIGRADLVLSLNPANDAGVRPLLARPERLMPLPPFLDPAPFGGMDRAAARRRLAGRYQLDEKDCWLICVAMMRPGAKVRSYEFLGEALAHVDGGGWRLLVIGDGPARPAVEAALPHGPTLFLGQREEGEIEEILGAADLFVWPAVDEAYGMAILEAQMAGLPVIAGRSAGVAAILDHGQTGLLVEPGDAPAFARALGQLLEEPERRAAMGRAASHRARREHGLDAAARRLDSALRGLGR